MLKYIKTLSIVSAFILTSAIFINSRFYCDYTTTDYLIEDIISVQPATFTDSSRCLLITDKGKINMRGSPCSYQIGQTFQITEGSNAFCFIIYTT